METSSYVIVDENIFSVLPFYSFTTENLNQLCPNFNIFQKQIIDVPELLSMVYYVINTSSVEKGHFKKIGLETFLSVIREITTRLSVSTCLSYALFKVHRTISQPLPEYHVERLNAARWI